MTEIEVPQVVVADASDLSDLEQFSCARSGVWYEEEAEAFVRTRYLVGPPQSEFRHYEPYVLRSSGELVAVAAVRSWAEAPSEGGTHLVVGAVALPYQGERLEGGEPLAGFLMRVLLQAARDADHGPFVAAVVARENTRSIRMCTRAGLTTELAYDAEHVRLVGVLEP